MEEDRTDSLEGEEGLEISSSDASVYPNAKVRVSKEQYSLLHVKRLVLERGEFMIDPEFQRRDVWNSKQRSELVESILMGIPLPIVYLFETKDGSKQVVDGRQRISTIVNFLQDEFPLKDLKILPEYNGKKFSDLPPFMQGVFEDFQLFCYVIQPPTPERVKYDIFDRVNRGGTKLNSQEMRNALYRGKITSLIETVCISEEFKLASDNSVSSNRMRDRYMVLRILSFYLLYSGKLNFTDQKSIEYRSDIEDFLAKVMVWVNESASERELELWKEKLLSAFREIHSILGKNAFRFLSKHGKTRPINMPLMEVLTYLFMMDWRRPSASVIREYIDRLKDEFDASGSFKSKVDSSVSVSNRFNDIMSLGQELNSLANI